MSQEEVIKTVGIMEVYRKERSKKTLDEHIAYVNEKLIRKNKSFGKEISQIERAEAELGNQNVNSEILSIENQERIGFITNSPAILSTKNVIAHPTRIVSRNKNQNYIKHGFLIILIIFFIGAVQNKLLNIRNIKQSPIVDSMKNLGALPRQGIEAQESKLRAIAKESTKKSTTHNREDYLDNTVGMPSIDQYNELAKSKGDNCRIGKVDNVWQRVCN